MPARHGRRDGMVVGGWQVTVEQAPSGAGRVDLYVSLEGQRDLCGQLYRQIRAAIVDGRLGPGQALPSTRELARRLTLSRNTVTAAYERLVAEGFLAPRAGAGTFVSSEVRPPERARPQRAASPLRPLPLWAAVADPPETATVEAEFDFSAGVPDVRRFPFATWRGLLAAQLRASAVHAGAHVDPAGDPGLRAAIARHLGVSRGIHAGPEDVVVTSGGHQAFDLVARVLLTPDAVVAVEDPGNPAPPRAFAALGARVVGVPVDGEGLVVEAIPAGTRLVYVCPSHQFPLGVPMSLERRLALLAWAGRADGVIVEDDHASELHHAGRPLEPVHGLDRNGRVVYVSSLSMLLLPTLRLGVMVAPPPLHAALRKAKHIADRYTAAPLQAAAARFIDQGMLARHVRRMRRVYSERHHLLTSLLECHFAGLLAPVESVAGLHMAALARNGHALDDVELVRRARAAGVAVQALSTFAVTASPRPGLVFGLGAIPTERIEEGLRRLRRCLDG
jgi:GntR family transcriptional regulator/MocR family aminotransferase